MTSNLLTKAGEIWLIFSKFEVHIILKSLFILISGFEVFSGTLNFSSFLLFFLSNNPFNLSITREGASFIQSKTTQLPSIIASYKNLGSNFINSLSSPEESDIFWDPIRSVHSKFYV